MKKVIRAWKIIFCGIFILICIVSMASLVGLNVNKDNRNSLFADSREALVIDDFESDEITNSLGCKANIYAKSPSRIMVTSEKIMRAGRPTTALTLKYVKVNEGGPNGSGGWCGYYTLLKNEKSSLYFDGTNYKYISFWVKGGKNGENFNIGLADRYWDRIGDSLKSRPVVTYLKEGKITDKWAYVRLPLSDFFLDYSRLAAISINFESNCFPEGKNSGIVYIDDLMLEK